MNVFSNGLTLNQLNQVFATGHGLALSTNFQTPSDNFIFQNSAYIRGLVQARQALASALIYGSQIAQLDVAGSGGSSVVAYSYSGTPPVETIVNPASIDFAGTIPIHGVMQAGTSWRDLLSGDVFAVGAGGVTMNVPKSVAACPGGNQICGLRILQRQ
jgi:hypothetical protein